jgi:uncharacterized membrane protein YeaQ/YmgE (transglycosylase-associated protein family)
MEQGTTYFLTVGLTYAVIGFAVSIIYVYVFRRRFLGRFWGALTIGLVGSFLGGVIDFVFDDVIRSLANFANAVNIFPALITAVILVSIFARISEDR